MSEYRRRRSSRIPSESFDTGTSLSPRKSSRRATASKISASSPRSEGRKVDHSLKSFSVDTEREGKRLMTEDEVSSLVHSALLRARQATSSFSPRARSARSPVSQASVSPRKVGYSSPSKSSSQQRTPSGKSPSKSSSNDRDIDGPPSLSRRSRKTAYTSPPSRGDPGTAFSFEGFQSPDKSEEDNIEVDIGDFSMESTHDDGTMTDGEDLDLDPTITSVNSSEAIIRRVEEEIANARKAAQEANRRLAGVSANLKDARAAADDEAAKDAAESEANKDCQKVSGESRNPSPSVNPSEEGGIDNLYDSAMDVIGEEFDIKGSKDASMDIEDLKDGLYDGEDPTMTRSEEDTVFPVPSTEQELSSEEGPDDENVQMSKRHNTVDGNQEILREDLPLSPSEEIDSLLTSNSTDLHDKLSSKRSSSDVSRHRTIDSVNMGIDASIDATIEEGPSEEIKTPKARGRLRTPKGRTSPKKESLDKKAQRDDADLLAMASIDEASIADEEIRASRDSAFDENMEDDDLLEWLPIGDSGDQHDRILNNEDLSQGQVDEEQKVQEASTTAEDGSMVIETANGATTDAIVLSDNLTAPEAQIDTLLGAVDTEKPDLAVDESQQESQPLSKPARCDSVELNDSVAEAKFVEENTSGDEVDLSPQKTTSRASVPKQDKEEIRNPVEVEFSPVVENIATEEENDDDDEKADAQVTGPSESNDEEKSEVEDMGEHQCANGDIFIYQVMSAGSTDAVATDRHPLPLAPSEDGIEEAQQDLETSVSRQEEGVIDEAIEVATEPIHYELEGPEEQVNVMIVSVASQVDTKESVEEEEVSVEEEEALDGKDDQFEGSKDEEAVNQEDYEDEVSTATTHDNIESIDDDQVTQVMSNTDAEKHQDSEQLMSNIREENSNDTSEDEGSNQEVATESFTDSRIDPPVQSKEHVPQPPSPSPRQIALVENRRAAQSQVDEARHAMIGESGVPTGLPNPDKEILRRVRKVKFKQRYPVPPPMKRPFKAAEIVFNNQTPDPKDRLHLSRPKKDLKELLEAAIGNSIQRRSNAFGALKVLSTQKKNKMTLVRTKGFLDSTVYGINENISTFEDTEAAVASRTRAVNVILNVSGMKDNRYHILVHQGLANSLVKCMAEDKGEARALACSVLATLAKSPACRDPMSKTHKLLDTLSIILKGDEPASFSCNEQNYIREEKKDYSGDDEASRHVFSSSYSSGSSGSHSSLGSSDNEEARSRARLSACAALVHLSKECAVAQRLCSSNTVLFCLVATCNETDNPLHTKCLEILSNMSRFPHNNTTLTTYPGLVDTLIMNGDHKHDVDRLWAMRTMQNLSSDPSSKTILATGTVLELLSVNIMRQHYDEQLAATAALYNISTEPGAVVPLTNTKNVVATLVHVAHNPTSPNDVRLMACDTLATLGLWLQTLAGAGTVPADIEPVPLPTYVTSGWKRWEN